MSLQASNSISGVSLLRKAYPDSQAPTEANNGKALTNATTVNDDSKQADTTTDDEQTIDTTSPDEQSTGSEIAYRCLRCDAQFLSRAYMRVHIINSHLALSRDEVNQSITSVPLHLALTCSKCGRKHKTLAGRTLHYRRCDGPPKKSGEKNPVRVLQRGITSTTRVEVGQVIVMSVDDGCRKRMRYRIGRAGRIFTLEINHADVSDLGKAAVSLSKKLKKK